MSKGVEWVESVEIPALTTKGVTIIYRSGERCKALHFPLDLYRHALALANQRLLEYEAAERERVVSFPRGRQPRH